MKKKLMCLMLASIMTVSLCSCGGEAASGAPTEAPAAESTPAEAPTAEPERKAPEAIEIAKSELGNPIGGFNAEGELTYGGDPSVLVDGDTVYLYTGRDTAVGDAYMIPDYQCYSTTDLENWTYEGVVLSMKDVSWADRNAAWAGQVAKHYDAEAGKDMYYFYFCSWDGTDRGKQSIGVAVSESPTGPFVDIGEALVKGSFTTDETSAWNDIDPTVWIEKDANGEEHRYLCWGNSKLYMCELNEDMISVKDYDGDGQILFETDVRKQSAPTLFTEAAWLYRRQDEEGNYYGDYYLFYAYGWREQLAYATAGKLMVGSWEFQDYLMDPTATSNTNHPAVFDYKGKTYMIYHNGSLPHGNGYRRVACIEELEIDDDGYINFVTETATGINGVKSTITAGNGEVLAHPWFVNSGADNAYPYTDVELGSNFDKAKADDTLWEIVPGRADEANAYYVSIEAYNHPGLYVTASEGSVGLTQDTSGKMGDIQTFKTVEGLSGEGVSFESVAFPGMYLTLTGGKASLTDGTDAAASSFVIE